jgi:glycosyltransferase involved in cell wall biosynthesis
MEKEILISIIIPVHNRQELIKETLDSVLAQSYQNWECIIVDDGSTDDTWKTLEGYFLKDSRFRIHKRNREPKGAPTCRNIGLEKSKGEFIIFLDSDDVLGNWALESRNNYIEKYNRNKIDVILSQSFEFNNQDLLNRQLRSSYGSNINTEYLNYNKPIGTPNPTWKKSFLQKNNITWYEKISVFQDVMFHIEAFNYNPNFGWSEEIPDVFIRVENGYSKISNSNELGKVLSRLTLLEDLSLFTESNVFKRRFKSDVFNRIEYLDYDDLKNLIIKHADLIKGHLGIVTFVYLRVYNSSRNINGLHGFLYRIRPVITFKGRNKFLKKHNTITEVLFKELKSKYTCYLTKNCNIKVLQ